MPNTTNTNGTAHHETTTTVLVTGGSGLVGSAINTVIKQQQQQQQQCNQHSNEQWIFLSSKDGDLRDYNICKSLFEQYKPTYVIHLAAHVGGLYANIHYPVQFWHDNIIMNENIIQVSHIYKVKKLISCLSTCIFPDNTTYPIDETMIHNGPPHNSNFAYAYAKRMIDVVNKSYNQQYNDMFTSIIPTNIYGPNDNYSLNDSHVIPGLIHKLYNAKQNNTDFTVYGTGKPLRQFIYSIDLARIIIYLLHNYNSCEPIIISTDQQSEVTISDVVNSIVHAMNYTGNIIYDTSKADGQYRKTASNTKLRKLLPDFQFTSLQQGINESVQWFIDNYDKARK